jgi:hypothetical protein
MKYKTGAFEDNSAACMWEQLRGYFEDNNF